MPGAGPTFPPDAPTLADGRYVLVSRIGEGGIAAVYKGYDKKLRVWRAVKLLLPEFSRRKSMCQRLESEALTMAQLEHPNLVRVYDVGYAGSVPFLVMELVNGGTLQHWTERHGPMPPAMAAEATQQVLRGLSTVHERGVVHRDVKPRNVLITPNGSCKLTDFGIARSEAFSSERRPKMVGTMGYSAPEQLADPESVDARADLYSVGALLWHLCTAKDVSEDLYLARHAPGLLREVHEALHPVILGCVAKDRDERFERADLVAVALEDALAELPADPPSTPDLVVDVSSLEKPLGAPSSWGRDFPELAQVIEEQRKKPSGAPVASAGAGKEGGVAGNESKKQPKPLPYVMQSPDLEARRRALLEQSDDGPLPDWIDQSSEAQASPPVRRTSAVPLTKELRSSSGEGGGSDGLVDLAGWSLMPQDREKPGEDKPADSARTSLSMRTGTPPPALGGRSTPPPAARSTPPSAEPAKVPESKPQAPGMGPLPTRAQLGLPEPKPPVPDIGPIETSEEGEARRSRVWVMLAVPLLLLVGAGTVFALAVTIYLGNGMLAVSDAALLTDRSRAHLHQILGGERELVDDMGALGANRSELERLYLDYLQERDPERKLAAARAFLEGADRELQQLSVTAGENSGRTRVEHRLRLVRNALRDYDRGLASWREVSESRVGQIVISIGLAEPAP